MGSQLVGSFKSKDWSSTHFRLNNGEFGEEGLGERRGGLWSSDSAVGSEQGSATRNVASTSTDTYKKSQHARQLRMSSDLLYKMTKIVLFYI